MPEYPSRSSVHLDVTAGAERSGLEAAPDLPFRILVVGDFSGRANAGLRAPLAGRRPVVVDRDTLDDALGQVQPALRLGGLDLRFENLDAFHPDNMVERLPAFRKFTAMREQPPRPIASAPLPAGGDLLEQMLDEAGAERPVRAEEADDLAAFLKRATASSLEPRADPRREEWAARIDAISAELMRRILHSPDFQGLEAAWRGLDFLTNRLDTGESLKIYIFDATLEELLDDEAGLQSLFVRQGDQWAVIAGNFVFGQTDADARRLNRLARAARLAGAPFLAEALPPSGQNAAEWQAFRRSPDAAWIGLAVPRFLLRLPYGAQTSPVERFAFEEMPLQEHAHYLWGNPAFCCVLLLAQAFLREGWQMRPGVVREVSGLPLHLYPEDGGTVAKPCAEVLLTERDADYLMENGFMPLASMKHSDSALLVRFQSVSDPLAALGGRWHSPLRAAATE